jgi:hypothetical protein
MAWAAGTLEEKVFQRQLSKEGLSNVVNQSGKSAKSDMSAEDLADLFTPDFDSFSSTYESMVDAEKDSQGGGGDDDESAAARPGELVQRAQVRRMCSVAVLCLHPKLARERWLNRDTAVEQRHLLTQSSGVQLFAQLCLCYRWGCQLKRRSKTGRGTATCSMSMMRSCAPLAGTTSASRSHCTCLAARLRRLVG